MMGDRMRLRYCNEVHPLSTISPYYCYLEPGHEGEHRVQCDFETWMAHWTTSLEHALNVREKYREIVERIQREMQTATEERSIIRVRHVWKKLLYWLQGLEHIYQEVDKHQQREMEYMRKMKSTVRVRV